MKQTKTKCEDCGFVTNGFSEWTFEYKGTKETAYVELAEDGFWNIEPLVELYGEKFENEIMDGEENCPNCGSDQIYEIIEDD